MKSCHHTEQFTFGDLITGVYGACDPRRAVALIRLAVNAGVLCLPRLSACERTPGKPKPPTARHEPARKGTAVPTYAVTE